MHKTTVSTKLSHSSLTRALNTDNIELKSLVTPKSHQPHLDDKATRPLFQNCVHPQDPISPFTLSPRLES